MPTWTEANAKLSVAVNGAYVPFQDVPKTIDRFVRPATFSTGDDTFELQVFGTAFMGVYRNLRFAMTTAHQASGLNGAPEAEKFVVIEQRDGKRLALPPDGAFKTTIDDPDRQSMTDLVFYDYSAPQSGIRPQHLDLSHIKWSDLTKLTPEYSFLIGFPTTSTRITLDEADDPKVLEFTLRWIRQDLEPAAWEPLDPPDRSIFKKHARSTRLSIEPDGLSGSPVFSIVADEDGLRHLRFDGIVTHARGDRFAVYPSATIRDLLDSIVDGNRHKEKALEV